MGKQIKDSEKLEQLLNALGYNAHALSVKLEYKSPGSIYHVLNGVNNLSTGMINRIVEYIPNVNKNFLIHGELPILLSGEDLENQIKQNSDSMLQLTQIQRVLQIPERLDRIEEMLEELLKKQS